VSAPNRAAELRGPAPWRRPWWKSGWKYASGAALTVAVVAGRLAMDPWWGRQQNRHLVFLPAVVLVAWRFGFGPGLLSAIISVTALGFFWMGTGGGVRANAELVLFFLVSAAVCALVRSLQRARDRADATRTSREQVLAVVTHDLRAPLTTIMVTSSSLRNSVNDAELVRRRLRVIDQAALRMESLIRDLLDAAGFEQGELRMTIKLESLASIVQEAIDLQSPQAHEAGITLLAQLPDHELLIPCDRQRILQVLGNLVGNALKFTPQGGRISLRVEEQERVVSLAVEDTGSGIDPQHLPHVFDRYWNADPRGIGLGLYIARSIVRAHGGDINVRSRTPGSPGQGTQFVFTIPRTAPRRPPRAGVP
jgi:signal transduction histidine kinase